MASKTPQTILWIDECYMDYAQSNNKTIESKNAAVGTMEDFLHANPRLFICKSLSKGLALSGLRVAYLASQQCHYLRRYIPPWAVSLPAQIATMHALYDHTYYQQMYERVHEARRKLLTLLEKVNKNQHYTVTTSVANFVCLHLLGEARFSAHSIVAQCRTEHGVFLRCVDETTIRISVLLQDWAQEKIAAAVNTVLNVDGNQRISATSSTSVTGTTTENRDNLSSGVPRLQASIPLSLKLLLSISWIMASLSYCTVDCGLQNLTIGIATSPTVLSSILLVVKGRNSCYCHNSADKIRVDLIQSLSLLLHQLTCTILWTAVLLNCDWGLLENQEDSDIRWGFLGFTLGAFASELTLISRQRDMPTWFHHASTVGLIGMLILVASASHVHLAGVTYFCAVSCPSYTCIPKLCRKLHLFSEILVDWIWCTALILWIHVRLFVLHDTFGLGFYLLRNMTVPDWQAQSMSSSSYYVSVFVTNLLLVVYLINGYWIYKKMRSIVAVTTKYFKCVLTYLEKTGLLALINKES